MIISYLLDLIKKLSCVFLYKSNNLFLICLSDCAKFVFEIKKYQNMRNCFTLQSFSNYLFGIALLLMIFRPLGLSAQCDPTEDSLALVALYEATDGDNWTNNDNWLVPGQPIDTWYGLVVNDDGCVTEIDLSSNNLTGELPVEIGNLSNLTILSLPSNQISGNIPSALGNLSNLTNLDLDFNSLTGEIPASLGTIPNLKRLNLSSNHLSGMITIQPGGFPALKSLKLNGCNLSGNIPPELGSVSSLNTLQLSLNNISGNIPPELGNLQNLTYLNLSKNELTGNIPPELGNLDNLEYLYLFKNQLSGTIPVELLNISQLFDLRLNNNQLTGGIPPELGNLTNLETLNLSQNPLGGEIPDELYNLTNIGDIILSETMIEGSISPLIGNFTSLHNLFLDNNNLSGALPAELANMYDWIDVITLRIDLSGNQFSGCIPPEYVVFCDDILTLDNNPGLEVDQFESFCNDFSGVCNERAITGKVVFDLNENCGEDAGEILLPYRMVQVTNSEGVFYTITNALGRYLLPTAPGNNTIELLPAQSPYWEENCTGIVTVNMDTIAGIDTIDFFPQKIIDCPYLLMDIAPYSPMRSCVDNSYILEYCNDGTAVAENAYIEVAIDSEVTITGATLAYTNVGDNVLRFDLGDVGIEECGTIEILFTISCDAVLGQTICTDAHIYPDSICMPPPEWSGANIEVTGQCDGDEVRFFIQNTGDGDMVSERNYFVVEDGIILMSEPTPFILNSGESTEVTLPANGSTYLLEAMQVEHHPIGNTPIAAVEGCGTNEEGTFSTGYITQFPDGDDTPFVSTDCQEVVGSYDPNDKYGYPKGFGEEHFVEKGQEIEYRIRFQNTGTDTAFNVVIEDVLSQNLEITSFRRGVSSHPYRVEIAGSDTLRFIFENIMLPDSNVNEPASHGFVKFKISPKADLAIGTQIFNTAAIYFDFNEPVLTNTTLHTIGEHFIPVGTEKVAIPDLRLFVAPNPMTDESIIRLDGVAYKTAELHLYNTLGVLVKSIAFNRDEVVLQQRDLSAGVYFFEVMVDGIQGAVGKLVVE